MFSSLKRKKLMASLFISELGQLFLDLKDFGRQFGFLRRKGSVST